MAVDPIYDQPGNYEILRSAIDDGRLEILFTHITLEELAATKDADRRGALLVTLVDLGRMVPTGAFVLDHSRLNHARISDDVEAVEAFRSGNVRHTHDALIAATAQYEQCALVTLDRRLTGRARECGIEVLTTKELIEECRPKAA